MPPRSSRKRRLWLVGATVLVAAVVVACLAFYTGELPGSLFARSFGSSGPRLELPACAGTDLGEGEVDQVLNGILRLKNSGSQPLTFRLNASCACAYLTPELGQVQPGEVKEVQVGVRLRQQGQDEHVVVRVETNDPAAFGAQHFFAAKCPAPFVVRPRTLDFGMVPEGTPKQVTLRVLKGDGEPFDEGESVSCRPAVPYLSISTGANPHEFEVRLAAGVPQGDFSGHLLVRLDNTGKEVSVPVTGRVGGEVTVAPVNVFLRFDSAAHMSNTMTVVVRRSDDTPLGKVTTLEKPAWLLFEDVDGTDKKFRRFRVRAESGWDRSPRAKVVLGLENVSKLITINVDVLARIQERSNVP